MSRSIRGSPAALAAWSTDAAAHAFGERYDLPLPLGLWLIAAALVVALSFAVFALAPRRVVVHPRPFVVRIPRLLIAALRAVGVGILLLLLAAGIFGTQDAYRNFAPAFVWIGWWIGFTYLVMLLGDLWSALNPWKTLYPESFSLRRPLPTAVGLWPACALLLAFAWIEIVWEGNGVPANIARLALGYSLLTWTGMLVFGREAWLRSAEVFTAYFGFVARLAPIEFRPNHELRLRSPAAGLLDPRPVSPSQAFFIIIMLAVVTFDGVRETPVWAVSDPAWATATTVGLLASPLFFAGALFGVCAVMARLAGNGTSPGELLRLFVPTLLPIALAYHVAHYLSYLLVAGQALIPLASDPLGRGWDLFGTAHYRIAAGVVGARFAWYTSVVVIVAGHVLAMYVAHRLALARFPDPRSGRRSQYPLAALMVAYTMASLWILAQPIV